MNIFYAGAPAAQLQGAVDLVSDPATATVAGVAPTFSITFAVSTATATVDGVANTLRFDYTTPAGTVTVDGVNEVTSFTYDVPAATATVAMPDVALQILSIVTLVVDTATVTVAANTPNLSVQVGIPAGEISGAGVTPTTSFTFSVAAAAASVEMPDVGIAIVETLTLVWDAAEADVNAVAPALSHTLAVPVQEATTTAVTPTLVVAFAIPAMGATVEGGEVILQIEGDLVVDPDTTAVEAVAPTLEYTIDANVADVDIDAVAPLLVLNFPAPTLTVSGDVIAFDPALGITIFAPVLEANVEGGTVNLTIGAPPPLGPVPGSGAAVKWRPTRRQILDFQVVPGENRVEMVPPAFNTLQIRTRAQQEEEEEMLVLVSLGIL